MFAKVNPIVFSCTITIYLMLSVFLEHCISVSAPGPAFLDYGDLSDKFGPGGGGGGESEENNFIENPLRSPTINVRKMNRFNMDGPSRLDNRIRLEEFLKPRAKCDRRIRITNGVTRVRDKGTLVRFQCSYGFQMLGAGVAVCVRGQWSDPPPSCVREGCRAMPIPLHGSLRQLYGGGVAVFSCNYGFLLDGERILTCDGQKWNGTAPTCTEIPPITIAPPITTYSPPHPERYPGTGTPVPTEPFDPSVTPSTHPNDNLSTTTLGPSVADTAENTESIPIQTERIPTIAPKTSTYSSPQPKLYPRTTWTPVTTEPYPGTTRTPVTTEHYPGTTRTPVTTEPYPGTTRTPVTTEPYPETTRTPVTTEPYPGTTRTPVTMEPYPGTTRTPVTTEPFDPFVIRADDNLSTTLGPSVANTVENNKRISIQTEKIPAITIAPPITTYSPPEPEPYPETTETLSVQTEPLKPSITPTNDNLSTTPEPSVTNSAENEPTTTQTESTSTSTMATDYANRVLDHDTNISAGGGLGESDTEKPTAIIYTDPTNRPKITKPTTTTIDPNDEDNEVVQKFEKVEIIPEKLGNNEEYENLNSNRYDFGHLLIVVGIALIAIGLVTIAGGALTYYWRKNKGIARPNHDLDGRPLSSHDGNDEFMWLDNRDSRDSGL